MVKWKFMKLKGDPEKVYAELQSLGDNIQPSDIVDFARNKKTELHKCFEWDDEVAAENYRLSQARTIMVNLVYTEPEEKEDVKIRVYQNTSNAYQETRKIIQNADEYKNLLLRAKTELQSFRQRYKTLSELSEIMLLIEEL